MKYTREEETDAKGRVICIAESLSFESDDEYRTWLEQVTTISPEDRHTLDKYFPSLITHPEDRST